MRPGDLRYFRRSGEPKTASHLYNLAKKEYLPKDFALIGLAKQPLSQDEFRERVRASLREFGGAPEDCKFCRWLVERLCYIAGDSRDAKTHENLKPLVAQMDQNYRTCGNYLFYFATVPDLFGEIIRRLAECGLTHEDDGRWRRVIIEKPFGSDFACARALNAQIKNLLSEQKVHRIDQCSRTDSGRLEGASSAQFPKLRSRHMGSQRSR